MNVSLPTKLENHTFHWFDYSIFAVTVTSSIAIGLYFGCLGKQFTISKYLMGEKAMKSLPIAASLVACEISSITLLAMPADVYRFGAGYVLVALSMVIVALAMIHIYLPVFYNLQITSIYEYLERRFDRRTRLFASFLFVLDLILYLPLVIYIPILALSTGSGVNVHIMVPIICAICIFYTTIGGLKSVVWTDVLQLVVMFGCLIAVLVIGVQSAGGPLIVWTKAKNSGRLDIFDFDPDPTKRESFWIIVVGVTVYWLSHSCVNQSSVMKFLMVSTYRDSKITAIYYGIGMTLLSVGSVINGLVISAKYSDCDPFTRKEVQKNDELVAFHILNISENIPGLAALFIAGILSASLSTLSTQLNSLAAVVYQDFVVTFRRKTMPEKTACNIVKLIIVVAGVICTCLVFVMEWLGGIFELMLSFGGLTIGPQLGLFSLGVLLPQANSKGAFYGGLSGVIVVACILVPAKYYAMQDSIYVTTKPLSTDNCGFVKENVSTFYNSSVFSYNSTMNHPSTNSSLVQQPNFIFRISFYYYPLIGAVTTTIFGIILSYVMANRRNSPVDKKLITPVCHFLLSNESQTDSYSEVASGEALVNLQN